MGDRQRRRSFSFLLLFVACSRTRDRHGLPHPERPSEGKVCFYISARIFLLVQRREKIDDILSCFSFLFCSFLSLFLVCFASWFPMSHMHPVMNEKVREQRRREEQVWWDSTRMGINGAQLCTLRSKRHTIAPGYIWCLTRWNFRLCYKIDWKGSQI